MIHASLARVICLTTLTAALPLAGCEELLNTRIEDDNRVGPDRSVLFFVHSHFHLAGAPPETLQDRESLVLLRLAQVNDYFAEQVVNISFVETISTTEPDAGVIIRTTPPSCGASFSGTPLTKQELEIVAQGDADPDSIHIHWIDRYADTPHGSPIGIAGIGLPPDCDGRPPEQNNAVILATTPAFGLQMISLAHEIGHYFGLEHLNTTGNLMAESESLRGPNPVLTEDQRATIWSVAHNQRAHLAFLSFLINE